MSDVPGLPSDVYFDKVDQPLPNWRKDSSNTDDPDKADEPDDNVEILKKLYGYDPSAWPDEE